MRQGRRVRGLGKTKFQGQLLGRYRDNKMGGLAVFEKAGTALGIPKGKVLESPTCSVGIFAACL